MNRESGQGAGAIKRTRLLSVAPVETPMIPQPIITVCMTEGGCYVTASVRGQCIDCLDQGCTVIMLNRPSPPTGSSIGVRKGGGGSAETVDRWVGIIQALVQRN